MIDVIEDVEEKFDAMMRSIHRLNEELKKHENLKSWESYTREVLFDLFELQASLVTDLKNEVFGYDTE